MKICAIDIGSNSVRLMMWADGKTLYKKMTTTRLGEGLDKSGVLLSGAMERTAEAVAAFVAEGRAEKAERIYAFGTAAVRSASNSAQFTALVKEKCGVEVDVVSGEREAFLGLSGALKGADGGIIDVGGASTEVTVRQGGEIVFSHSFGIGTVRIFDGVGRDRSKMKKFIDDRLTLLGGKSFPSVSFCAIGGTASRLGAIKNNLTEYKSSVIDGTQLSLSEVEGYAEMLTSMPVEEIARTTICGKSAEVVGGGAALLAAVMAKLAISRVTVSESDNLEGYVAQALGAEAES